MIYELWHHLFMSYLLKQSDVCILWQILDGHNGPAAAIYSKENLLKDVMSCIPPDLTREEWLNFLPRAMVAGFVKTDKDWQQLGIGHVNQSIQSSFRRGVMHSLICQL